MGESSSKPQAACRALRLSPNGQPLLCGAEFCLITEEVWIMASWKCAKCGYTVDSDTPPEECPSCKEKCEFLDVSCYTPDCEFDGNDKRLG